MIRSLLRVLWRLLVFFAGALTIWFTIFKVVPYADARLPVYFVALLVYLMFAYLIIPTLVRILRLFDKPNHIPLYAITPDGLPSDPVNIAIVASSREQLMYAMEKAGWYVADTATIKTSVRFISSIIFNLPYPTAPFSNLYLFGRVFDIGFQKPSNLRQSPRSRHHVRFWRLELPAKEKHTSHFRFWHNKLQHLLGGEDEVWIGTAIEDVGLGISKKTVTITHQISSDTDAERDIIIDDLKSAKQVQKISVIEAGEAFSFHGHTLWIDGPLVCDGTLTVVELKARRGSNFLRRVATPRRPRQSASEDAS